MRDHSKRFTHREWKEDYVQKVIDLAEDCDKEIELEPAPDEDFRWSKEDVRKVVDALIAICPDNASESQGGTGDESAPFNDKFYEKLDGVPGDPKKPGGHWSQYIINKIDEAIERGCCECCWFITVEMDVDFLGNVQPNPQTPTLIAKAPCDATSDELGEMFEDAFNTWLTENQDTFPEGGVTFTPLEVFLTAVPGEGCDEGFRPPIVEN